MRSIRVALVVPRNLVRAAVDDTAAIDLPLSMEVRCLLLDAHHTIPGHYFQIGNDLDIPVDEFKDEIEKDPGAPPPRELKKPFNADAPEEPEFSDPIIEATDDDEVHGPLDNLDPQEAVG